MSGHASHKSTSTKPHGNAASGQVDLSEQDPQPETGYPYDADDESETIPEAIEWVDRPEGGTSATETV